MYIFLIRSFIFFTEFMIKKWSFFYFEYISPLFSLSLFLIYFNSPSVSFSLLHIFSFSTLSLSLSFFSYFHFNSLSVSFSFTSFFILEPVGFESFYLEILSSSLCHQGRDGIVPGIDGIQGMYVCVIFSQDQIFYFILNFCFH